MTARAAFLRQAWQARTLLTWLLWPLSLLLRLAVACRRTLYACGLLASHRLPVPVVVVGNVLLGGVGKTPVVMALTEHLQARGWRVGVISRGYGRRGHEVHEVTVDSTPQDAGDEALLIARRCQVPVVVGADRPAAARWLLQRHPETDVILSDDGLQHLALAHDLALCVFDERGLGNGWLFPAGPLREPWPRPRQVPQWLLYSVPEATLAVRRPEGQAFVLERRLAEFAYNASGDQRSLSHWQTHPCHALAAIAKPEAFFNMLKQQGVQLCDTLALPDHDPLTSVPACLDDGSDWLCTEKDASKLWQAHPQAWAVPLEVTLPAELLAELETALEAKLSSSHGHKTA
ncbi:MAG: tetraacyldisaccharide 4'-kinase [Limnohabitans sp.]|nr:tetraacyldisaccharide 4'-kinase [Limnohabitans sp.]